MDAEDKDVAHDGVTMGEIIARSDGSDGGLLATAGSHGRS